MLGLQQVRRCVCISIFISFPFLLFHSPDKRGIEESMNFYIDQARLTACEVVIFLEKYPNSQKYTHTLFEEALKLVYCPMGEFLEIMGKR